MAGDIKLYDLPAKPGRTVDVGWSPRLGSFIAIVREDGAETRYGVKPGMFTKPEQLFEAIKREWLVNEACYQHVYALLSYDEYLARPATPLNWSIDGGRGR